MIDNYHLGVSYYCSWVQSRFRNAQACGVKLNAFEEPIKSWVEVGDKNYLKEPEWQTLRSYIFESLSPQEQLEEHKEKPEDFLSDDEWVEKVRKECEEILKGNG